MVIRGPEARLLAGPTAFALLRMRFRGTTVALVFLAIIYVVNASGLTQFIWAIYISAAAMLVSVLFAAFLIVYVAIKTEAEGEAGYTTLQYGNRKLEQRDPYLGRVIRGPGEDYFERTQFQTILQAARVEAERLAPNRG